MTENNNDNKHNAADDLKDAKVEVTVESKGKENDLSVKDNGGAEESGDMPKETGDKEKQEPPTPDEIIADLRIKLEESEDKHLRLAAEFDNFRKRTARQYEDMIRVANQNIISQILEVVDNFERALEAADKSSDHDSLYKGMKLVYKNENLQKSITDAKVSKYPISRSCPYPSFGFKPEHQNGKKTLGDFFKENGIDV